MDGSHTKWIAEARQRERLAYHGALESLRPRLTACSVVLALVILYVLYCTLVSSPLFASKLPPYTGPHGVGTIDVEVPVRTPRKTSNHVFEGDGKPAFELETVLFTLYYPAAKGVTGGGRSAHYWIPKPVSLTAEGYARAVGFNNFISRCLFTFALWAVVGSIRIPAEVDVPLLLSTTSEKETDTNGEKFPVVVLSHGLASSRTGYTHYCGELAARGVVVAAIEHRDGSSPGSAVTSREHGVRKRVRYLDRKDLRGGRTAMDSDALKSAQLAFRQAEIEETIAVLRSLDAGNGADVSAGNARGEGRELRLWEKRLDFSRTVVAGHSFGATGALQVLRGATSDGNPAVGGVVFDPGKRSGRLNTEIDVPILVVHSDSWSRNVSAFFGRPHFDAVRDLVRGVAEGVGSSWFLTFLRTSHASVTDAPLIEPLLLRWWTTGLTIGAREGLDEYVRVSMGFLEFLKTGVRSGVLLEGVTHEEYGKGSMAAEQKKRVPKEVARHWQIHIAPPPEAS